MGADQIAAISPALRELFNAVANDEPEAESLCVTFTVPECDNVWLQVMHGTINAAYPRSEEPTEFLRSASLPLLSGLNLESWKSQEYVTWSHAPCTVQILAAFLDQLLITLHSLSPEDYDVDVTLEHVAGRSSATHAFCNERPGLAVHLGVMHLPVTAGARAVRHRSRTTMIPLQNLHRQHLGALLPAGVPDDYLATRGEWTGECVFMALPTQPELFDDPGYHVLNTHSHRGLGEHRLHVVNDGVSIALQATAIDGSELFIRLPQEGLGTWGTRASAVETQLGFAVRTPTNMPDAPR